MKSHINLKLIDHLSLLEQDTVTSVTKTENLSTCVDSSQSLSGEDMSNDLQISANVKGTVLTNGYFLAVLCLCWLLRNAEKCEERFLKIKNIAELKSRRDIFKCLENIRAGNFQGKLLLRRMEGINPILLAAGINAINDLKSAGKITPHLFRPARNFESFRLQVPIEEADVYMEPRTFDEHDYNLLFDFYQEEDGSFTISNAITSLFTDIVLSCFMDCDPNLHIVSSGSKQTFADLIDVGEMEFVISDGTRKKLKKTYRKLHLSGVEPCARSAAFLLKWHRFFKRLYRDNLQVLF